MNCQIDNTSWKNEQLSYFKEYLKTFKPGTREYNSLVQGIKTLEKAR